MRKTPLFQLLAALLIVAVSGAASFSWANASKEKVVKVVSRRFVFEPAEIVLRKGVPVVIEITTDDVVMGFSVPDLKQRGDVLPKQVTRVHLKPDKTGTYPFLCDIFCGSGHENMNGVIKVVD